VRATAWARVAASRAATARQKLTGPDLKLEPEAVRSWRARVFQGVFEEKAERSQRWYNWAALGQRLMGNSALSRRMSPKRSAQ